MSSNRSVCILDELVCIKCLGQYVMCRNILSKYCCSSAIATTSSFFFTTERLFVSFWCVERSQNMLTVVTIVMLFNFCGFVVFHLLSHVSLFVTSLTAAHQISWSFTVSQSLLKLMSIESVMPSKHLILCRPLLLSSIFAIIRVFPNEWTLSIRWLKFWSFSISPSSEYSGLISFRMDWFDLFAVQGTLKSLLQHHSLQASVLWQPSLWSNSYFCT